MGACRGATVGVGDMVTLEEGRGKGQAATVKHVMRSALFLHSKSAPCCPAAHAPVIPGLLIPKP